MHTTILFKLSVVRHVLCDISKIENNKFERALECKIKNAKKIPLLTYLSSFLRPPPKKNFFANYHYEELQRSCESYRNRETVSS